MARKRKSIRAGTAGPRCPICFENMYLKGIIPAAHIFPELKTFSCTGCGNLRTVENEAELMKTTSRIAA
jgi:hypothetical protein